MAFKPFSIMGEHIDEHTREFAAGVGAIALIWAHVELALDVLITIEAHIAGTTAGARHPIPFTAKIDRLTKAYRLENLPTARYRGELAQIISVSTTLAKKRHMVVHGALMSTLAGPEIELIKITRKEGEEDVENSQVTLHEMFVLFDASIELVSHTYNLAIRMVRENAPELADRIKAVKIIDVSRFHFPPINPKWVERQTKREAAKEPLISPAFTGKPGID